MIVEPPVAPRDEDLEHSGCAVGHRRVRNEGLHAFVVRSTDLDRPVALQRPDDVDQIVDPVRVAPGERPGPHDLG